MMGKTGLKSKVLLLIVFKPDPLRPEILSFVVDMEDEIMSKVQREKLDDLKNKIDKLKIDVAILKTLLAIIEDSPDDEKIELLASLVKLAQSLDQNITFFKQYLNVLVAQELKRTQSRSSNSPVPKNASKTSNHTTGKPKTRGGGR
jgi:hypothetical protein